MIVYRRSPPIHLSSSTIIFLRRSSFDASLRSVIVVVVVVVGPRATPPVSFFPPLVVVVVVTSTTSMRSIQRRRRRLTQGGHTPPASRRGARGYANRGHYSSSRLFRPSSRRRRGGRNRASVPARVSATDAFPARELAMQRLQRRIVDDMGVGIARDNAVPPMQRTSSWIGSAHEPRKEPRARSLEEEGDTVHARGG